MRFDVTKDELIKKLKNIRGEAEIIFVTKDQICTCLDGIFTDSDSGNTVISISKDGK